MTMKLRSIGDKHKEKMINFIHRADTKTSPRTWRQRKPCHRIQLKYRGRRQDVHGPSSKNKKSQPEGESCMQLVKGLRNGTSAWRLYVRWHRAITGISARSSRSLAMRFGGTLALGQREATKDELQKTVVVSISKPSRSAVARTTPQLFLGHSNRKCGGLETFKPLGF
jgi:hypothetical protein